jgi:hypothetical protein
MTLIHRLEIILGISFVLSFWNQGKRILFPFQIFTTWVHECWHAIAVLLAGGSTIRITMENDGSGLTRYRLPAGRFREAFVASAGYLGASATGCLIFFLAITAERPTPYWNLRAMVITLASLIALSLIFWMRNLFGWVSTLILGLAIASLLYSPMSRYAEEVLLFLAIQTALNALFDIRTLFSLGSRKGTVSDAHTLQKLFYLPHWCWSISWLGFSFGMMYWTVHHVGIF